MPDRRSDVWTKAVPTEDGYYWHRESIAHEAVIRVVYRGIVKHGLDTRGRAESYGGEWFGPLQKPGGDAIENCPPESDDVPF